MRVKFAGGDNGHNGLRSIRASLGTGDFFRVRVGIGRPPGRQDPADFVLSNYSSTERKELPFQVDRAADAVESLLTVGLAETQQRFNMRGTVTQATGARQPISLAMPTAASCEDTSSLARIDFTWVRTVASETVLSPAIWRTARPFIRWPSTTLSRSVSCSSRSRTSWSSSRILVHSETSSSRSSRSITGSPAMIRRTVARMSSQRLRLREHLAGAGLDRVAPPGAVGRAGDHDDVGAGPSDRLDQPHPVAEPAQVEVEQHHHAAAA